MSEAADGGAMIAELRVQIGILAVRSAEHAGLAESRRARIVELEAELEKLKAKGKSKAAPKA